MRIGSSVTSLLLAAGLLAAGVAGADGHQDGAAPLRMGLLLNFSDDAGDEDLRKAFDLAVEHLNAGGGVLGQPVEVVTGDPTLDPAAAVVAARRLVEEEGVHVLVGPGTSGTSIPVAEQVSGPAGIPTISPAATSPVLAAVADRDFLFRTALSDSAQGPILARVTRERGFDNVALIYYDDPWGQGLAEAFVAAWTGTLTVVSIAPGQTTYLTELRRSAAEGAQALVVVAFEAEGVTVVREAIAHDLYDRFIFSDALKSLEVAQQIGVEQVAGTYGVAGAAVTGSAASTAWKAAYRERYGELPVLAYVKGDLRRGHRPGPGPRRRPAAPGGAGDPRPVARRGQRPGTVVTARAGRGRRGIAHPGGRRGGRLRRRRRHAGLGPRTATCAAATSASGASPADGRIEDLEAVPFGYE